MSKSVRELKRERDAARKAHEEAEAQARKAYREAVAATWKACEKAERRLRAAKQKEVR